MGKRVIKLNEFFSVLFINISIDFQPFIRHVFNYLKEQMML